MALADRYYMRDAYHAPRMTTRLIVILIIAFVIQSLLLFYGNVEISEQLALSVEGLRHGKVWQLLTFQFLHTCPWPWHVLFNCLGLYFFGRPVEEMVGARKFLFLYLLCGVAGGLLQALVTIVLPRHMDIPVVGASAGVCGMIAIFCSVNPMDELTTWIYFLPITIRARYFLLFLGGFSLFGTLVPFSGLAHGAHLGGILMGLAYVRFAHRFSGDLPGWIPWPRGQKERVARPGSLAKHTRWRRAEPQSQRASDYISREVDPILDKISAQGFQSLTEKERKTLEAARARMESRKQS
jgi:membrane associated rhomboid family serine protease